MKSDFQSGEMTQGGRVSHIGATYYMFPFAATFVHRHISASLLAFFKGFWLFGVYLQPYQPYIRASAEALQLGQDTPLHNRIDSSTEFAFWVVGTCMRT